MNYKLNVVFTKDEQGYYVYAPELPGCHSQGDTFEEASVNIKEAIELYLETVSAEEIKEMLSKEIVTIQQWKLKLPKLPVLDAKKAENLLLKAEVLNS